jgi:hypothetical protein
VGVPQGSPISGVLANVFLSAFDRALERAGIVFLRYLDDVTILAASPEALATGLGTATDLLESLRMSLMPEKTQAAWLGGGAPPARRLQLPGRGHELPVAGEIDFLGIHFLGPERFRAPSTVYSARSARRSWRAAASDRRGSGISEPVAGSTSSSATSSPAGPSAAGSARSATCSPASTRCSATPS